MDKVLVIADGSGVGARDEGLGTTTRANMNKRAPSNNKQIMEIKEVARKMDS